MPFTPLRSDDPALVGPYRLTGQLGAGGMGIVYLARTRSGTPVALKLIRPEYAADPTFRARFAREVAVGRRVEGVCIARFLDADTEAERPYLVTEYVDGPGLGEVVTARGPFGGAQLQALAAGLAEGLASLHAAGVVHRDLKPSNVLLARDAPKIIDFGIAHAGDATSMTRTGHVVGSAGWMSPEQAAGDRVTPASDVFAWASTMAFAATGRPPFGEGQPAAVIYRVVHHEPDLDGVPSALLPALRAAFAKEPGDRPGPDQLLAMVTGADGDVTRMLDVAWAPVAPVAAASAAAARAALDRPLTEPDPGTDGADPSADRSRVPMIVLAAVLALALGGLVAWALLRDTGGNDEPAATTAPAASTSTTEPPTTTTSTTTTTTAPPTTTTTAPPPDAADAWADVEAGLASGSSSTGVFAGPDGEVAVTATGTAVRIWSWSGERWEEASTTTVAAPVTSLERVRLTGVPSDDVLVRLEGDLGSLLSLPDRAGRLVPFDRLDGPQVREVGGPSVDGGRVTGRLEGVDGELTWRYDPSTEAFSIELVDGEPPTSGPGNGNGPGNGPGNGD